MKFKEAYGLYTQGVNIRVPICNETKANLFEEVIELTQGPETDRIRLEYYKLYLESCGDIESRRPNKPFICYSIYVAHYALPFERTLRGNLVNRKDLNEFHCKLFNIPPRYFGMTFDTMKDIPEQKQIINTTKNWIKNGWKDSLLLGSKVPGVGKTNTMVCTAMQRFVDFDLTEIRRFEGTLEFMNSSIIFIKERELVEILNQPGIYKGMILDRLSGVDYLVYDDMLSVGDNKFTKEILTPLIDNRVDGEARPMGVTTRASYENLKRHHPDIFSRLSRGVIYYSNSQKDLRKGELK